MNKKLPVSVLILLFFSWSLLGTMSEEVRAESGPMGLVPGKTDAGEQKVNKDIDRLVDILKNDKKRQMLIRRLETASATGSSASAGGSSSEANGETLSEVMWEDFAQTGQEALETLEQTFTSPRALFTLAKRGIFSLVLIIVIYLVWRTAKRRLFPRLDSKKPIKTLSATILLFILFLGLFFIWGLDYQGLLGIEAIQNMLKSGITIIFVLSGAYIVWELVNHILHRHLASLKLGGAWDRRLKTLLPLVRSALLVILSVITLLIVLSELGINIAPLLAGAGIVGLAIGFGAQTLVKDLLTGFFVLLENTINIGDWVLLGGHDGQVEGLTIRHVTVRDIYGNLHTVPWSSVVTITNQTREFGFAVVEVGFAYRENIDQVIEVVKEVAEEMRRDPTVNTDILSELQILGLIELGDSAVVVRTRFKTAPFSRWRLERDFRRRIKNRFDELGIEIPFPHQTVYFGQDKTGQAPPARIRMQNKTDVIE